MKFNQILFGLLVLLFSSVVFSEDGANMYKKQSLGLSQKHNIQTLDGQFQTMRARFISFRNQMRAGNSSITSYNLIELAKKMLSNRNEMMKRLIERNINRLENDANIDQETRDKDIAQLKEYYTTLEDFDAKIDAIKTKEDLTNAVSEFKQTAQEILDFMRKEGTPLIKERNENVISKLKDATSTAQEKLDSLDQEDARVKKAQEILLDAETQVSNAQAEFDKATDALENSNYRQFREHIRQGNKYAKQAFMDLRQIKKMFHTPTQKQGGSTPLSASNQTSKIGFFSQKIDKAQERLRQRMQQSNLSQDQQQEINSILNQSEDLQTQLNNINSQIEELKNQYLSLSQNEKSKFREENKEKYMDLLTQRKEILKQEYSLFKQALIKLKSYSNKDR